jgi:uncharacterized phage-associated protein
MATDAHKVANEFLRLAKDRGVALTPLQLMKLVYIAHGWMLGLVQRPLITNRIEAWKYGPVIPDLYNTIKKYGSGAVASEIRPWFFSGATELDDTESQLIHHVYDMYGDLSGIQLSAMTHKDGTPWALTYRPDIWNIPISNDIISEHYRGLGRERTSKNS